MPDAFELVLAVPSPSIDLDRDKQPTATARIDVTSRLGRSTRVGAAAVTTPDAAPLTCRVEPAEFHLADGATQSVEMTFEVGDTDQDAEVAVVLRAYAVDDPQGSWAASPSMTVSVNRIRPFPWWIAAVVVVVLLGVVGGVVALLAGGDEFEVADVVGSQLAAARSTLAETGFEDDAVAVHTIGDVASDAAACVLFQTPQGGELADAVDLLVVACPEPDVEVASPLASGDLCQQAPTFCVALEEDLADADARQEALTGQLEGFLATFTIEGVVVPSTIGFELDQAQTVAMAGGLEFDEIALEGTADQPDRCVLYQYPLVDSRQAPGYTLTVVSAACPAVREQPDEVVIEPAVLVDTADPCSYLVTLCDSEGLASADLQAPFAEYLLAFRERFSAPLVPDLVGDYFHTIADQLALRGLELEVTNAVDPEADRCRRVANQTPGSGVLAADVPGAIVTVTLEAETQGGGGSQEVDPGQHVFLPICYLVGVIDVIGDQVVIRDQLTEGS